MADAVMRALVTRAGLDDQIGVCSAGTGAWHVGDGADRRAQATLARAGYDASAHKARRFTRSWFAENDLILAVDQSTYDELTAIAPEVNSPKLRLLREFDPEAGHDLDVPDPYYGGPGGFDEVLAMVERSCRGLLEHVTRDLVT
jgi:protein-tyrosine phosphatase